ncbi:MAG: ABC transporter permease subunit [Bacteroidetes bacterium]|nr:ABC transporter permease subunit [Bacteroidota bacterium]
MFLRMKLISVIRKSIKEQLRNFWILILTVSMAPFFVFVYYLILESEKPHYDVLLLNQDKGITYLAEEFNYGNYLMENIRSFEKDSFDIPLTIKISDNRSEAIKKLKNRKADALVIIPENFSQSIHNLTLGNVGTGIDIEFVGDLTNVNYMISAIWVNEMVNDYLLEVTESVKPIKIKETSLGISGKIDDFDLVVPGLLILSIIMLMFSATVAIITEVENKTIIRLKLSKLNTFEFLSGISIVQMLVGLIAIFLSLFVALLLGFDSYGSFSILILVAVLTSFSIIAFSLILAALTKTVNEILIVGNFPLFLFMFFTGAAFPIEGKELFSIAGYPLSLQGLMSPTHAISALKKVLILNMGLKDVIPEIVVLVIITVIYFAFGVWLFQRRHMKVD